MLPRPIAFDIIPPEALEAPLAASQLLPVLATYFGKKAYVDRVHRDDGVEIFLLGTVDAAHQAAIEPDGAGGFQLIRIAPHAVLLTGPSPAAVMVDLANRLTPVPSFLF